MQVFFFITQLHGTNAIIYFLILYFICDVKTGNKVTNQYLSQWQNEITAFKDR